MKRKKLPKLLFVSIMLLGVAFQLQAQTKMVSGTIISEEDGKPLPRVSVVVQGTNSGTATNEMGKYTISVPSGKSKIVVSHAGFVIQTIDVGNRSVIDVTLVSEAKQLTDIVVTALGVNKQKKALTFATQELAKKDLTEARDVNVANYLTGKIAGVQVSVSAGGVGGSSKVIIRGISSLTGENQPLYIVDGIPLDNTKYGEGQVFTEGRDFGDGIGNINPQDIESINVLKGPNATALYGSRGSNGVIIITTKSGKGGRGIAVEVNSNVTIDRLNLFPKLQNKYMTGYEDLNLYGDKVNIGGTEYETIPTWHFESLGPPMKGQLYVNPFVFDKDAPPTTFAIYPQPENNVRDFFNTGVVTNNSIAVSNATDRSAIRLSVNNTTIKGIIPNHKENQQSVTLRASTNITNKLSIEGKVNYIHKKSNNPPGLGVFSSNNVAKNLIQMGRYVPLPFLKEYYEKTGTPGSWPGVTVNPYYLVNENKNNAERDRIIGFFSAKYQFTNWLSLMARSGIDQYSEKRLSIRPVGFPGLPNGRLNDETILTREINSDALLTASKNDMKNFTASISLGASISNRNYRQQGWEGLNFKVPGINDISNTRQVTPFYSQVKREIQSVYASAEAGYKNYLFLNVTGRNDWSSTLGENNYSFFYPSVGGSFVFTDALNIQSRILSYGKIRASYAEAGNDASAYLTQTGYYLSSTPFNGLSMASQSNTISLFDLKNELKKSIELGLDLRFLNDHLALDITAYKSNTKNQIVPVGISSGSGYTTKIVNAGDIENKGIEISLQASSIQLGNNLRWDMSFNYARNYSKVKELAPGIETFFLSGTAQSNFVEARTGEAFGNIIGYKYKRAPDGQIIVNSSDGSYAREDEYSILGNVVPKWTGGLNNTLSFKGISLNFLIDFVQGNKIVSETKYRMMTNGTAKFTERYREHSEPLPGVVEVTDANGNVIKYEKNTMTVDGQTAWAYRGWGQIGEEFVLDGSFVMLREVILGYAFQPSFLNKTPFKSIKVSLVGRNLWYIDEHMQGLGISPETNLNTSAGSTGVEVFSMPTTRSYGINLNFTF